jgi:hypothetical protein
VVLQGRQGFVRLALSWGCDLVPVYGMGVTDLYTTYSFAFGFRKWLAKAFHIALPLFTGRFGTPLPHQVPVTVLIGEPIVVPKPKTLGEKPSDELVNEYHGESSSSIIIIQTNYMHNFKKFLFHNNSFFFLSYKSLSSRHTPLECLLCFLLVFSLPYFLFTYKKKTAKYIAALEKMFNDHCESVYGEKRELQVIKA